MEPGSCAVLSNGGSSNCTRPASRRTRCWSSASIACLARSGSAAPDSTDQLCEIESMVHSSLAVEPSGAPLSNHARRYQAPSQASRSEEHTSELQSLMRISYAVFCLKKKKHT